MLYENSFFYLSMNIFLSEITSQGKVLSALVDHIAANYMEIFAPVRTLFDDTPISRIIFTGMGSSFFSSFISYYMLKQHGFPAEMIEAGEFLLHGFPALGNRSMDDTCVIAISQSGESGEIVELLKQFAVLETKPYVIGVTNAPHSHLAANSDYLLLLLAGNEDTVTSKTYLCTLLILYFLAKCIIDVDFSANIDEEIKEVRHWVQKVTHILQISISEGKIRQEPIPGLNAAFGNDYSFVEVLARGPSLATAHQAALNFKEVAKINSEAAPVSTFRHGGIESLTRHSKLVILSSTPQAHPLDNQFLSNVLEKWEFGRILYITTQNLPEISPHIRDNPHVVIYSIGGNNPFLAPLVETVVLQLIIFETTQKRGISPGTFRFTQKITRGL
jgi:glutamine---fructose-6-phosphate transaminase (isomerizing)